MVARSPHHAAEILCWFAATAVVMDAPSKTACNAFPVNASILARDDGFQESLPDLILPLIQVGRRSSQAKDQGVELPLHFILVLCLVEQHLPHDAKNTIVQTFRNQGTMAQPGMGSHAEAQKKLLPGPFSKLHGACQNVQACKRGR